MTRRLTYVSIGLLLIVGIIITTLYRDRRVICRLGPKFTIATVTFNEFVESFPATGTMKDSSVVAEIDELYLHKIKAGFYAQSYDKDLIVTEVDSTITSGRFSIKLRFKDGQQNYSNNQYMRFRIFLSNPTQATLLPVGGFYRDTGGKWILVVKDSMHIVKRHISLGRRNPDYFEVLSGLMPGERVITSSYENYTSFDFAKPVTIPDLFF